MLLRLFTVLSVLILSGCVTDRSITNSFSDTGIDVAIKNALLRDKNYDTSDIDITVFEGRVMLTGTVRNADARNDLSIKAQSVRGVEDVINEVIVGPKTGLRQGTRDALIDSKLANALRADNGIYRHNYQFSVSDGVIYVLGVSQGPNELARVISHAQVINGVENVVPHVVFVKDPRR